MYETEYANLATTMVRDPERAVAYFQAGTAANDRGNSEQSKKALQAQREEVFTAARRMNKILVARFTDFWNESDYQRPGMRQLLDYAAAERITHCFVDEKVLGSMSWDAAVFWQIELQQAGIDLVAVHR